MPKITYNALTDTSIRNSKSRQKQYKIFDGQGLFVLIHPNGSKYFRYRYKFEGKEKVMALGVYPETTLKEAREKRLEAQRLVKDGLDPVRFRLEIRAKREKEEKEKFLKTQNTFEHVSKDWLAREKKRITYKHAKDARRSLEMHVYPKIGNQPIDNISTKEIKSVLSVIQDSGKLETAHRVHQRIRSVFQFAVMNDLTERNPAADPVSYTHLRAHET